MKDQKPDSFNGFVVETRMATLHKIPALISNIEHGTEADAFEAAKQLAAIGETDAIPDLRRILRAGAEPHSREAAAYALAWLKNRGATLSLLECAADVQEQDSVRGQAIEGLASHLCYARKGTALRAQAEELMIHLLQSPSPTLRFWACFGLGTMRCERAIPDLQKLRKNDQEICPGWWPLREEAEDALERIAGRPGEDRVPVHLRKSSSPPAGPGPDSGLAAPP